MKKNIIYFTILTFALTLLSCSLEEDPKYVFDSSKVYNSEKTAEATIMSCYGSLAGLYGDPILTPTVCNGTMVARLQDAELIRAVHYDVDPNGGKLASSYGTLYKMIDRSNNVLVGMETSNLDKEFKDRIVGQAYFIRGYAYYMLASLWGRASIQLEPVGDDASLKKPLSPRVDVYAQAESDWLKAAKLLPEVEPNSGMANRNTANAYLAKLYFMLASQKQAGLETSKYNSAQEIWKKAVEYGEKVTGKEFLEPDYASLFGEGVSDSKEIIFQINYTSFLEKGIQKQWNRIFGPYYYSYYTKTIDGSDSYRSIVMDRAFYDLQAGTHPDDVRMKTIYITNYQKETKYKNEQERTVASYPFVYDKKNDKLINGREFMLSGSDPKNPRYDLEGKPKNPEMKQVQSLWTNTGYGQMSDNLYPFSGKGANKASVSYYDGNNVILFRNADLLLILADAYNELGNTAKSDEYLNLVLNRAKLKNAPSMSQAERRDYIFFERMFELAGEPILFEDIRRRGTEYLKKVISVHNNSWFVNYRYNLEHERKIGTPFVAILINDKSLDENFLKKNLLLPIPQEEIIRNDNVTQADQNFGY